MSETRRRFLASYLNVDLPKDQEWRLLGDPELLSLSQRLDALRPRVKSHVAEGGAKIVVEWAADLWAAIGAGDKSGAATALDRIMDAMDDLPTGAPPTDRVVEQDADRKRRAAELKTAAGRFALHERAPADEFPDLVMKRDTFVTNVPDLPDPEKLRQIEKVFTVLEQAFQTHARDFAERLSKLAETAKLLREDVLKMTAPDGASGSEKDTIARRAKEIADGIPAEPLRESDLKEQRDAAGRLATEAAELKSVIEQERRPRHLKAGELKKEIEAVTQKCAAPPLRESDAKQLGTELQEISTLQADYADWDKVTTWNADDLSMLEEKLKQVSGKIDTLLEEIERLGRDFEAAAVEADTAVTDTSVFALSAEQQKGFSDRIAECRKAVAADVFSATEQQVEVKKIAEEARAFAKLLGEYKARVEKTPEAAPKGVLPAETKLLAKKRKAALDALAGLETA